MLLCCTGPLPRKSGKTRAGNICPAYASLTAFASAKISYALPLRSRPPSFCLISPEAFLMTGKRVKEKIIIKTEHFK